MEDPGDDWKCGDATRFRVIVADGEIEDPEDGDTQVRESDARPTGVNESAVLTDAELGSATHAGVFYRDDAGNWGLVASIKLPDRDGPVDPPGRCETALNGDAGPNVLAGTALSERIRGKGGDDSIRGRGGDDCIGGGTGDDKMGGGKGADVIRGGKGKDKVSAGPGDDVIRVAGKTRDFVRCGPGTDTVFANRRDKLRGCEKVKRR